MPFAEPRPCRPLAERFWAKVDKRGPNECWPWSGCKSHEYGSLRRGRASEGMVRATHVAWFLHTGEWPAFGIQLCHSCDNPPCVNPRHLFPGDHVANAADRERKGRTPRGDRHGNIKITSTVLPELRRLVVAGLSQAEIGRRLGVKQSCIWRAMRRHGLIGKGANAC